MLFDPKTIERLCNEWGHIAVVIRPSKSGVKTAPPADNEYAVDPFGVEIIIPSERHSSVKKSFK